MSLESPVARDSAPSFDELYEQQVAFVWRSLRRLGVSEATVEDAVQDVFLVVHRRLRGFEGRSTPRTWLYGIVVRVARDRRRSQSRKRPGEELSTDLVDERPGPFDQAASSQAVALLDRLLARLDPPKREVLVLAEIEQLTAPEIAEVLEENVNTIYSRLRAARQELSVAVERVQRSEP